MAVIKWSEALELGVAPMDGIHKEFVALLQALAAAADGDFVARLAELIAHTEEHFEQESVWMKACAFPPIHCHEEEHAKVLTVLRDVKSRVEAGDLALGRTLARELSPWFENHAVTMDNMLALYIKQQGYAAERQPRAESAIP